MRSINEILKDLEHLYKALLHVSWTEYSLYVMVEPEELDALFDAAALSQGVDAEKFRGKGLGFNNIFDRSGMDVAYLIPSKDSKGAVYLWPKSQVQKGSLFFGGQKLELE